MEILDHIRRVHSLAREDVQSALTLLAETDLTEFLSDQALVDSFYDPILADMFSLSEDGDPHLPKSVRKERRKMDRLKTMTAHLYAGVPKRAASWGHEAHAEGLRAFGMERSAKASPEMKMKAHHEAHQAHMLAAHHLSKAGHKDAAALHQRAANFHHTRKARIASQHELQATEARNDRLREMARLASRREQAGMDQEPDKRIQGKKKPDYSMGFPKEEQIQNWIADLDEAEYPDEVKRASKLAANATAVSKEPHANATHHETAARMHFIAKGVALAHKHNELAAKHDEFVKRHRAEAAKIKAAS